MPEQKITVPADTLDIGQRIWISLGDVNTVVQAGNLISVEQISPPYCEIEIHDKHEEDND